jgi:uncharacterized protein
MTEIEDILQQSHTIAIVGYSAKAERPSHWIADYLEVHGYQVYRVNPVLESTAELPIYPRLAEIPVPIDIVDIFRAPEHAPAIVQSSMAIGAKTIWMQPGAENPNAAEVAQTAGLKVVVGTCLYAEHKRQYAIEHHHP